MSDAPYPAELYPGCPCHRCDSPTWPQEWPQSLMHRMTLCPRCGSKRCRGAMDHDEPCSGEAS